MSSTNRENRLIEAIRATRGTAWVMKEDRKGFVGLIFKPGWRQMINEAFENVIPSGAE